MKNELKIDFKEDESFNKNPKSESTEHMLHFFYNEPTQSTSKTLSWGSMRFSSCVSLCFSNVVFVVISIIILIELSSLVFAAAPEGSHDTYKKFCHEQHKVVVVDYIVVRTHIHMCMWGNLCCTFGRPRSLYDAAFV